MTTHQRTTMYQHTTEPSDDRVRMPVVIAVLLLLVVVWLGVRITHNVTDALHAVTSSPEQTSLVVAPPAR